MTTASRRSGCSRSTSASRGCAAGCTRTRSSSPWSAASCSARSPPPARARPAGELRSSTASPSAACSASARSTTGGSGRERGYQVMRRLDHSMIFIFIAGTYTPFCVLLLPDRHGDRSCSPSSGPARSAGVAAQGGLAARCRAGSSAPLYLALGWVAVAILPDILHRGGVAVPGAAGRRRRWPTASARSSTPCAGPTRGRPCSATTSSSTPARWSPRSATTSRSTSRSSPESDRSWEGPRRTRRGRPADHRRSSRGGDDLGSVAHGTAPAAPDRCRRRDAACGRVRDDGATATRASRPRG